MKGEVGYYYYYGLGEFSRAAKYLDELLQIAPNNVEILTLLSFVKRRQGRWAEAISLLQKAIATDPRNLSALRTLRENLDTFRHWDEAIALQQRILAIAPDNLDESTILHDLVWKKSGSFASYDGWRKSLPEDALGRSPMIWVMDMKRAIVYADLDSAIRLLEAPPQVNEFPDLLAKQYRAMMLLAKGERSRAQELARASLVEVNAELKKNPRNFWAGVRSYLDLAVLGQREAALAAQGRWQAMVPVGTDAILAQAVIFHKIILHAVLGDRDRAVQLIEAFRKRPTILDWGYLVHFVALLTQRADPRFETLSKDLRAPIPIANWGVEKVAATN